MFSFEYCQFILILLQNVQLLSSKNLISNTMLGRREIFRGPEDIDAPLLRDSSHKGYAYKGDMRNEW